MRMSSLLDEALDLDGPALEAWLDELGRQEPELGPSLRRLIERGGMDLTAGSLRQHAALGFEPPRDFGVGERIGPYRLVRELGAGGMGEVWLAERADGAFERRVALKLPLFAMRRSVLVQRFERERNILAALEHPLIARLYDAGVAADGQPYLAMEFVEGQPIDVWCRDRALDIQARVGLVVQVARAVAYAHSQLVIHRDLKPANILVTGDDQVRLLDFGVAKLLQDDAAEPTELTRVGGRALTPRYASPEQLRGEPLGTASDVYSLGVVAYELLAGAGPYRLDRGTAAELEEAITGADTPLASTVARDGAVRKTLTGDLDAILNQALKKDPRERYASAAALADDFDCYLTGRPVAARPDSAGYRLRKFMHRHRPALSAAALILFAIGVGGVLAIVQAQRAHRAIDREQQMQQFVAELFRAGTSAAAQASAPADSLADRSLRLIDERFPDRPDLQADLHGVVGRMFADMGAYPVAAAHFERQLQELRTSAADAAQQARVHIALGEALQASSRFDEARAEAQRAFDASEGDPEVAGLALSLLAADSYSRGQREQAHAEALRAMARLEAASHGPSAQKARLHFLMARSAPNRSDDVLDAGYRTALAMAHESEGELSRTAAEIDLNLGLDLVATRRADEGRRLIETALDVLDRRGGADAIWAASQRATAWARFVEIDLVNAHDALPIIRSARMVIERHARLVPAYFLDWVDFDEGRTLLKMGNIAEATPKLTAAARLRRTVGGLFDVRRLWVVEAKLAMERGEHDAADAAWHEVLNITQTLGRATFPDTAYIHAYRAYNRLMQGDTAAAKAILDAAPSFGALPSHPTRPRLTAELLTWQRARLLLQMGRIADALDLMKPLARDDDVNAQLSTMALEAEIQCAAHRPDQGLPNLRALIQARAVRADWRDPMLARYRAVAGLCALDAGHRGEARQWLDQAREALTAQPRVSAYYHQAVKRLQARIAGR